MFTGYFKIYYSRFCSLPVVGSVIYRIQLWLISFCGLNSGIVSGRENPIRDRLMGLIDGRKKVVLVKSYRLGRVLSQLSAPIVFDWIKPTDFEMDINQTYDLMWSLVFAENITGSSKESLGKFVPQDFPVVERSTF